MSSCWVSILFCLFIGERPVHCLYAGDLDLSLYWFPGFCLISFTSIIQRLYWAGKALCTPVWLCVCRRENKTGVRSVRAGRERRLYLPRPFHVSNSLAPSHNTCRLHLITSGVSFAYPTACSVQVTSLTYTHFSLCTPVTNAHMGF